MRQATRGGRQEEVRPNDAHPHEFQRFEHVSPTIWLRAQSASDRISIEIPLQRASTGQKIAPKSPAMCRISDCFGSIGTTTLRNVIGTCVD